MKLLKKKNSGSMSVANRKPTREVPNRSQQKPAEDFEVVVEQYTPPGKSISIPMLTVRRAGEENARYPFYSVSLSKFKRMIDANLLERLVAAAKKAE